MLTPAELVRAVLVPLVVAAAVAAVGRWRRWAWAMPAAVGAGFLAGYILLGAPSLPPRNGNDWLFWLAIPVTGLGVLDAVVPRRWGWALGAAAGAVGFVVVRPLVPGSVKDVEFWVLAGALARVGADLCLVARVAEARIGPAAVVGGLGVVLAGAAVVVLSSNSHTIGAVGFAAAAAVFPVAAVAGRLPAGRSVAVVVIPLLAGLLVAGHYYPDPGVSWVNFAVLMAAPVLLLPAAAIPAKRKWVGWARGAVAVALVAAGVAAVTVPTARAAKKAAETSPDPYGDAYDAYK